MDFEDVIFLIKIEKNNY